MASNAENVSIWWRHHVKLTFTTLASERMLFMATSSNGNIFRVTGHLCGEFTSPGDFPAQRPVTRSFDVFFDLRPDKRLSKQPWGWWFETPSWSLWRQCNVNLHSKYSTITVGYFLLLFPCLSRQFRLKDYSMGKTAMPDHIANSRVVSNYKCFPEPICYLGKTSKADQATCHRRQRTLNISGQNFG